MPAYAIPYDDAGPLPGTGVAYANGVVLIDPATGNPVTPAQSGGAAPPAANDGASASGTVGTTSAVIVPAGTYKLWCMVQNTHASEKLYLSFGTAAATDFVLAAGASITLPAPFANALNGVGSAAGTTYARIGV